LVYRQGALIPLFSSVLAGSLIVTPIVIVLFRSLTTTRLGAAAGFTVENYFRVLHDPQILPMIKNSIVYAAGSATLGTWRAPTRRAKRWSS
jgi:ABC-type spermidine/putrescine transport system permease subunit II